MPIGAISTDQEGEWHISGADLASIWMAGASIRHFEKFKKEKEEASPLPLEKAVSYKQPRPGFHRATRKPRREFRTHFQMGNQFGAKVRGRDTLSNTNLPWLEVEEEETHYRKR